jgi:hypothetical protein
MDSYLTDILQIFWCPKSLPKWKFELPLALAGVLFGAALSLLPIPDLATIVLTLCYLIIPMFLVKVAQFYFGDNEPPVTLYRVIDSIIRHKEL